MKNILKISVLLLLLVGGLSYLSKDTMLEKYNLKSKSVKSIVEHFEYDFDKTPNVEAVVFSDHLELNDHKMKHKVKFKDEGFYLSIAPYRYETHPCTYHIPTSCQGELSDADFNVKIIQDDGTVLFDDKVTTSQNGFFGIWLPKNIDGTLIINDSAYERISTHKDAPTCLTTVKL